MVFCKLLAKQNNKLYVLSRPKSEYKTCSTKTTLLMKTKITNSVRFLLLTFLLFAATQLSAQIAMQAPEPYDPPGGGDTSFTKICAGIDQGSGPFNSYDIVISWAGGLPNAGNEFILELSDASGDFTSAVELARVTDQNTNSAKEFVVNFAVPTDVRGAGYKFKARSTDNVSEAETASAYSIYYIDIDSNLNISELGDGNPPGNICSDNPITLQVDNIPNPETYQYLWFRGGTPLAETSHTISAAVSGMYQAQIDYGDCSNNANTDSNIVTVTIGATGSGVNITTPTKTALCFGETETLTVEVPDGSSNYEWFKDNVSVGTGTSFMVNGSTAGFEGDYEVEISGIGICTERSPAVTMTNAGNFNVTRSNPADIVVLPSQPETLSVTTDTAAPTYEWFRNGVSIGNDSSTLEITQDGTYYVAVTSTGACASTINSDSTEAVTPASFEIVINYDGVYASCTNTSIDLEVSQITAVTSDGSSFDVTSQLESAFAYQWQKNGTDVSGATNQNINLTNVTENGDYTVDASLNTYSATSNMLAVQLLTSETVTIASTGTIFCSSSDALTISTTTDLSTETFSWERDGVQLTETTVTLNVTATGTYRLVLDKNGCDLFSNEIIISGLDPNLIGLDIDGDVIFPEGSSRTVTARGGTGYQWLDADNNMLSSTDSMTFTEEGSFTLVADVDNCQVTRQLTAIYLDTFKVPNVITPNGDGANDQWVIPNSYSNKSDVNVIIYNDKGVELMNETNYQNTWPESSASFPNQNMVFYYVIKNASETLKQGTITVIR